MQRIDRCPCCDSPTDRGWPAIVAPFIAEFVLAAPVTTCRLLECARCRFRFFDERFDESELSRLYGGYRGEAYFECRHRHEFWYTRRFNDAPAKDRAAVDARRGYLSSFLGRHCDAGKIERILDYGGDAGQLLPPGLGTVRHVFEVSDVRPVEGVTRIGEERALEPASYDLVILSHVLEHAPDPVALLRRLRSLLRPRTGLLYVEVPWERYDLRSMGRGSDYERYLRGVCRVPRLLRWIDFYSSAFRVRFELVPPLGFPKLHEHINFFVPESLARAFERSDLTMGRWEQKRLPPEADSFPVLSTMARRSDD